MIFSPTKTKKILFTGAILLFLFTTVNPFWKIDLVLIALFLLTLGHVYMKEKLILVFLALRPVLDIWRDVELFTYQQTVLNVNAALSLLVCVWGILMLLPRLKKLTYVPGILWLFGLFVLMAIGVFTGVAPLTTVVESMKFVVIALLFALAFFFEQEKKVSIGELLLAVAASAIFPILFGAYQLFFGAGITTFGIRGRIFGTFAHPNVFAFFLLSLLMIHAEHAYIRIHDMWKKHSTARHIITGVLFLFLLMTFTRAAWVGLFVFLFVIGLLRYRTLLAWSVGIVVGFFLLIIPADALVRHYTDSSLQEFQIVQRLTARNEDGDSIAWRLALVEETIPIIAMRPLVGYGYGTFELVWGDNKNLVHLWDDSNEAHNDYLRFALELGIFGLGAYGLFLLSLLMRALYQYRQSEKKALLSLHVLAWILAFGAMSLTDNMLHHTPVMWLTAVWWGAMFGVLAQEKYEGGWNFLK